jgi:hypothetical protein
MGRIYTAPGENMTLGTGNVLLALQTAAGVVAGARIAIRRIEITQNATATAAQVRIACSTRDTAGTLTTTSVTPQNISPLGGPASGLVGNTSVIGGAGRIGINSSADSGGTYTNHYLVNPNNLNGWFWVPTPEERIIIPPSTVWCVRFLAAPGTTTGWTITVTYEELT